MAYQDKQDDKLVLPAAAAEASATDTALATQVSGDADAPAAAATAEVVDVAETGKVAGRPAGHVPPPTADFRQIRAIHDASFVRVYQAYNDAIADAAVAANSFRAPLANKTWSATRMTWVKPSAVWMAYRCGWGRFKDKNQARVLALDLARPQFDALLMGAQLSHGAQARGAAGESRKDVVVQWDPERVMDLSVPEAEVYTRPVAGTRSIQIGLRQGAVEKLLDPTFLLRITDVTPSFARAAEALVAGDVAAAAAALWPAEQEQEMEVPTELRAVLEMSPPRSSVD